ncbi:hypothetical protein PTTG_04126 [Puccinia triticina 1-1 BBBD Race 1]|uniref:Retrotransposon gag domain-containing protein n=1 Tax=Puccinia triticina (isolate 1-1 / race 1 (BBBD)) TaxID=630390 RepID=A0A0C4ETJ7_PUCT1|nr:hypothetical protein PTTG_04126 [Puccinia triticina 1-1 BBBD Race 1]
MSTRRTTAPEDLLAITNPNAIIRAANAEKRRLKQLESSLHSDPSPDNTSPEGLESLASSNKTVRPDSLPPALLAPIQSINPTSTPLVAQPSQPHPPSKQTRLNSSRPMEQHQQGQSGAPPPDYMKMLVDAQLAVVDQARKDRHAAREEREANAARMARMEEATLALIQSVQQSPPTSAPTTRSAEAELPQIRTSDAPCYTGPAQAVEPFLKWIHRVQVFFATKAIESDVNKIWVVGSFIDETNLLSVYANKVNSYVGKSWQEFKERLFEVAITPDWREELHKRIVQLRMLDSEDFMSYSIRARTLQRMINFDKPPHKDPSALGDLELARLVMYGMPDELKAMVKNFKLLKAANFKYGKFKMCTNGYYQSLPKRQAFCSRAPAATSNQTATGSTNKTVWRVHAFLDSQGRCHFCKKCCGSAPGACKNPIDRSFIKIPDTFVAPPKPADYQRPAALGPLGPTPGRPTQHPAGCPGPWATSVAAASEVEGGDDHPANLFPDNLELNEDQVSALQEIREEELLEEWDNGPRAPEFEASLVALYAQLAGMSLRCVPALMPKLNQF